jgi:periplasmic divalent cation tolerance protein
MKLIGFSDRREQQMNRKQGYTDAQNAAILGGNFNLLIYLESDTFFSHGYNYSFMSYLMVYVTAANEKEAKNVADYLLKKHLVACANIFPINSLYWWKGEIQNDSEVAIIMKTQNKHTKQIIAEIKSLHSYEVPCIEFLQISDGNSDYLKWIEEETTLD